MTEEEKIKITIELEQKRMSQQIATAKAQKEAQIKMMEAEIEAMEVTRKKEKRNEKIDKLLED